MRKYLFFRHYRFSVHCLFCAQFLSSGISQTYLDHPPLAKGSFGVVYTGKVPRFPKKVVVKDMDIYDQSSIAEWKKELTLMT